MNIDFDKEVSEEVALQLFLLREEIFEAEKNGIIDDTFLDMIEIKRDKILKNNMINDSNVIYLKDYNIKES